jgi:hypothetical protein
MVSVEQQIVNLKEALTTGKVAPDAIAACITEGKTVEERLSRLQTLAKTQGIRESRVQRKNGSGGMNESAVTTLEERIARTQREHKCSFREASILVTGKDPGKDAKQSKSITESLVEKWRRFAPFLTSEEVTRLAEKGIEP